MADFTEVSIYMIDMLLFLCLSIQSYQASKKRKTSDYQQKLSNYKLTIFGLAYGCLLLKVLSQTVVTFNHQDWGENAEIILAFVSATLPTLFIISIASTISRFWYEIVSYMTFIEYDIE